MKKIHRIVVILSFYLVPIFGQVNTEAMRDNEQIPGLHHQLSTSFAYISGSSNISGSSKIMILNGDYRMDYHSPSNWHGFFVTRYDRAFEKNKDDFTNKGFAHLRAVKNLRPQFSIEGFLQKEFNYFIDLKNRELVGGGVRFNPFEQFFIGIGAMHEAETYDIFDEQNFIKSTNYINFIVKPIGGVTIQNILYYQFKLEAMEHYRILWDGTLSLQGSDWLSFYISCQYRFDISEIEEGSSYFEITNGLSFRF